LVPRRARRIGMEKRPRVRLEERSLCMTYRIVLGVCQVDGPDVCGGSCSAPAPTVARVDG